MLDKRGDWVLGGQLKTRLNGSLVWGMRPGPGFERRWYGIKAMGLLFGFVER